MTPPRGTLLLDVLSTEMPGPGHCRLLPGDCCCLGSRCHAAQPGPSAQVTMSSLDLWSFESRVFKERKGLVVHQGLSGSVWLEELKRRYQRNGWVLC